VQGTQGVRVAYEIYLIDQTVIFMAALEAARCTLSIDYFFFSPTTLSPLLKNHDGNQN
jgi:hypothetical protein